MTTSNQIVSYMRSVVEMHRDSLTGIINATTLGEDAAVEFDRGEEIIDDSILWEAAYRVAVEFDPR